MPSLTSLSRKWLVLSAASFMVSLLPASASCKVKAIFVQPPVEVPEKAVLAVGKKFVDIELPQRNFSPEIEVSPGAEGIVVLPTKPTEPELPVGAPGFRIPDTWTNCILLFFHDSSNKVFPAKIIPLNISGADFPLGHTLIFNVSPAMVMAKLGTETVRVMPGQSVNVKPPRAGSGEYLVSIDCGYPGEKEPIALCRSTWQHEAKSRQILFVTPMPEQKIPRVWGVLDREPDREPAKE